jgi:hypothetical protein
MTGETTTANPAPGRAKRETKESIIIGIMTANADRPMHEVLALIVAEPKLQTGTGVDLSRARAYYSWISRDGLAPGKVEAKAKKDRPARPDKNRPVTVAKLSDTKTPAELERMRLETQARIREVNEKLKKRKAETGAAEPAQGAAGEAG